MPVQSGQAHQQASAHASPEVARAARDVAQPVADVECHCALQDRHGGAQERVGGREVAAPTERDHPQMVLLIDPHHQLVALGQEDATADRPVGGNARRDHVAVAGAEQEAAALEVGAPRHIHCCERQIGPPECWP